MSTSHEQATSSGRSDSQAGDDGDMEIREDLYEEAFSRMKKAAGVSDVDEVVRRFETQEETTNHLLELQVTIFFSCYYIFLCYIQFSPQEVQY